MKENLWLVTFLEKVFGKRESLQNENRLDDQMPPKRASSQPVNHVYVEAIQKMADQEFSRNPDSKIRYVYIVVDCLT